MLYLRVRSRRLLHVYRPTPTPTSPAPLFSCSYPSFSTTSPHTPPSPLYPPSLKSTLIRAPPSPTNPPISTSRIRIPHDKRHNVRVLPPRREYRVLNPHLYLRVLTQHKGRPHLAQVLPTQFPITSLTAFQTTILIFLSLPFRPSIVLSPRSVLPWGRCVFWSGRALQGCGTGR